MKISKIKFGFLFFIACFLLKPLTVLAWVGYEEDSNIMIDILPESEVEIGNDISYYDFKVKAYRNAYVTLTDFGATGTRIEVKEIETKRKRVFIMDE